MKVKTEIQHTYEPSQGMMIIDALAVSPSKYLVLCKSRDSQFVLDRFENGEVVEKKQVSFKNRCDMDRLSQNRVFLWNESPCFFDARGNLVCLDRDTLEEQHTIAVPFLKNVDFPLFRMQKVAVDSVDSSIYVGMFGNDKITNSAKSIAKLEPRSGGLKSFLFGRKELVCKGVNELSPGDFPPVEQWGPPNHALDNYLNIQDIVCTKDCIWVHTNGGQTTRLKAGTRFEFNILAKYTKDFDFICKYDIDFGFGKFSEDKNYFVFRRRGRTKALAFFGLEKGEYVFDISLTPKQNMGTRKLTEWLKYGFLENELFLYDHSFLNVCLVKEPSK